MSALHHGGPAFPLTVANNTGKDLCDGFGTVVQADQRVVYFGMSMRDYFAAKALQGMLAHPECDYTSMSIRAQAGLAEDAYAMADAMLDERRVEPEGES